jgi:hypothetical protein
MVSTLGLALAAASSPAFAEGLVVPKAEPAAGTEAVAAPSGPVDWTNYTTRPLTLGKGMVGIHGDLVSTISTGQGGKPVWITPNVLYGITDQITAGIAENPQAEFLPVGGGLCLTCSNHNFNVISPIILFSLQRNEAMEIVPHVGIDYQFDPSVLSARAGMLMKFVVTSQVAIMADPTLVAPTMKRNLYPDAIFVPVRGGFQANPMVNFGLITGVNAGLDGPAKFSQSYSIPVGVNGWLMLNDKLDVGLDFTFTNLAGKGGGLDGRTVAASVNYRIQ